MVTVRGSRKTEYVVALENSDGEFLTSGPVYHTHKSTQKEYMMVQISVPSTGNWEETQHLFMLATIKAKE